MFRCSWSTARTGSRPERHAPDDGRHHPEEERDHREDAGLGRDVDSPGDSGAMGVWERSDLPDGYLNFVGLGGRFAEAAGALRLGLAVDSRSPVQRGAGELLGIGDIP